MKIKLMELFCLWSGKHKLH